HAFQMDPLCPNPNSWWVLKGQVGSVVHPPEIAPSTRPDGGLDVVDFRGYRFLSDLPLDDSAPLLRYKHFVAPMLRQFPRAGESIQYRKRIGQGGEGAVYRVRFGGDGQNLALKIVSLSFGLSVPVRTFG